MSLEISTAFFSLLSSSLLSDSPYSLHPDALPPLPLPLPHTLLLLPPSTLSSHFPPPLACLPLFTPSSFSSPLLRRLFALNGERYEISDADPSMSLMEFICFRTRFRDPKLACGEGDVTGPL